MTGYSGHHRLRLPDLVPRYGPDSPRGTLHAAKQTVFDYLATDNQVLVWQCYCGPTGFACLTMRLVSLKVPPSTTEDANELNGSLYHSVK